MYNRIDGPGYARDGFGWFVLLPVDAWKGLMLIEVDFGQLLFDTFSTDQP